MFDWLVIKCKFPENTPDWVLARPDLLLHDLDCDGSSYTITPEGVLLNSQGVNLCYHGDLFPSITRRDGQDMSHESFKIRFTHGVLESFERITSSA